MCVKSWMVNLVHRGRRSLVLGGMPACQFWKLLTREKFEKDYAALARPWVNAYMSLRWRTHV